MDRKKKAEELHGDVPPNWYYRSLRENILQRFWHNRRFEEVSDLIEPVDGKVLDLGCADGVFTRVILEKSKAEEIIGVDVLKDSVAWAKKHWKKNKKMKFRVADAHNLPFKNNSFHAVFSLEMLEHVFDPSCVMKEIKRVLKKGGYGVLLVPSDSILFRLVWFLWHYSGRMVWKGTHLHTYKNNYLTKLCEQAGFEMLEDKKFLLDMLHIVKIRKK